MQCGKDRLVSRRAWASEQRRRRNPARWPRLACHQLLALSPLQEPCGRVWQPKTVIASSWSTPASPVPNSCILLGSSSHLQGVQHALLDVCSGAVGSKWPASSRDRRRRRCRCSPHATSACPLCLQVAADCLQNAATQEITGLFISLCTGADHSLLQRCRPGTQRGGCSTGLDVRRIWAAYLRPASRSHQPAIGGNTQQYDASLRCLPSHTPGGLLASEPRTLIIACCRWLS